MESDTLENLVAKAVKTLLGTEAQIRASILDAVLKEDIDITEIYKLGFDSNNQDSISRFRTELIALKTALIAAGNVPLPYWAPLMKLNNAQFKIWLEAQVKNFSPPPKRGRGRPSFQPEIVEGYRDLVEQGVPMEELLDFSSGSARVIEHLEKLGIKTSEKGYAYLTKQRAHKQWLSTL